MEDSPPAGAGASVPAARRAAARAGLLAEQEHRMAAAREAKAVAGSALHVAGGVEGGLDGLFLRIAAAVAAYDRDRLGHQPRAFEAVRPGHFDALRRDLDPVLSDRRGDAVRQVDVAVIDARDPVFARELDRSE